MDVCPTEVAGWLKKYHADLLVHGHTHRPDIEVNGPVKRIVLGAWHDGMYYLVVDEDKHCTLYQKKTTHHAPYAVKHFDWANAT